MTANTIRIVRIWTDYVVRKGVTHPVDRVEICAVGAASKCSTIMPISYIMRARVPVGPEDLAGMMASDIKAQVMPYYEAYKKGQEVPDNGTPIGGWPGITQEQATVLKSAGFRTVEEIAASSDGQLSQLKLPNARHLVEQAALFLAASDKSAAASAMAEKDAQIARMRDEQEEMKRILLDMQRNVDKPRRGRPPKNEEELEDGLAA